MHAYIKGIGYLSPQPTWDNSLFLEAVKSHHVNNMYCLAPDYKQYIRPIALRRMSRLIRMGLTSALISLQDAGIDKPGAIVTGTGMGCVEDTENFLTSVAANKEEMLTPTAFIRSTHNTVGAHIAVHLKCHAYNFTYVHRGFSFESALADGRLLLAENAADDVLVGGLDETSEHHYIITGRLNYWKVKKTHNLELLSSKTPGSIAGEGAAFFVLGKVPGVNDYGKLLDLDMFARPESEEILHSRILTFLQGNAMQASDIDLLLMGYSGDVKFDPLYEGVSEKIFPGKPEAYFKHLSGEYHTSSAAGLWYGTRILQMQYVPEVLMKSTTSPGKINNILIYNNFRNEQHSLMLIST